MYIERRRQASNICLNNFMDKQRNTKQKQLILSILCEAERPLSINEIYSKIVNILPSIAKSTIYRNIDSLLQKDLIDKYNFNQKEVFYRFKNSSNEHKHYVICDNCKNVFDLPMCPINQIENSLDEKGFIVQKHQIEISGICKNCSNKI